MDIGWLDLLAGAVALVSASERERRQRRVEDLVAGGDRFLCCLSVRSALDLYLQAVALPAGSEVLMTALNIPDMGKIVASHGLVPVPVDLDPETLAPAPGAWLRAAGPRTRALLVAHLFGCRSELDDLAVLARERGWLLLEDGAQAYTGRDRLDDSLADASFVSFGLIKTATALAGALVRVADPEVLRRMRAAQARQPVQGRGDWARRLAIAVAFKALAWPPLFGAFVALCRLLGGDADRLLSRSARSFAGADLLARIRRRPSAPLLALLERRLRQSPAARVRARCRTAREILARLPATLVPPGRRASFDSHWVVPIRAVDPVRVTGALRAAGFDAAIASSLTVLDPPPDRPDLDPVAARHLLAALVYLPAYPALPARARDRLVGALRAAESGPS
ncbi:MAG TPA: DegT/DnrJ/EryC1/StrS family aminotransferase [Polyangia bacterium]|nr:DegT/DnrJ/EryC1/StrS family aminotransferase [Polyangia bacterium]